MTMWRCTKCLQPETKKQNNGITDLNQAQCNRKTGTLCLKIWYFIIKVLSKLVLMCYIKVRSVFRWGTKVSCNGRS